MIFVTSQPDEKTEPRYEQHHDGGESHLTTVYSSNSPLHHEYQNALSILFSCTKSSDRIDIRKHHHHNGMFEMLLSQRFMIM